MLEHYILNEVLMPAQSEMRVLLEESKDSSKPKTMYMEGIVIQAEIRNQNGRIYPLSEIRSAVTDINDKISKGYSICGEIDHPTELSINLDRISHNITKMWMDGTNGCGKLRILNTPSGNIARSLIEDGIKLGCSSRGSGSVGYDNIVSDFEIVTIDLVLTPSGPDCFPVPVLESMRHKRFGKEITKLSNAMTHDSSAQKYLTSTLNSWLNDI